MRIGEGRPGPELSAEHPPGALQVGCPRQVVVDAVLGSLHVAGAPEISGVVPGRVSPAPAAAPCLVAAGEVAVALVAEVKQPGGVGGQLARIVAGGGYDGLDVAARIVRDAASAGAAFFCVRWP